MAYEVPPDVGALGQNVRVAAFLLQLLHIVLTEVSLSALVSLDYGLRWLCFAYSNEQRPGSLNFLCER